MTSELKSLSDRLSGPRAMLTGREGGGRRDDIMLKFLCDRLLGPSAMLTRTVDSLTHGRIQIGEGERKKGEGRGWGEEEKNDGAQNFSTAAIQQTSKL